MKSATIFLALVALMCVALLVILLANSSSKLDDCSHSAQHERQFVNKHWKTVHRMNHPSSSRVDDMPSLPSLKNRRSRNESNSNRSSGKYHTTIVTAYYDRHTSRNSSQFHEYMNNLLALDDVPVVLFSDDEATIRIVEEKTANNTLLPLRLVQRPFASWPMMEKHRMERIWKKQLARDPRNKQQQQLLQQLGGDHQPLRSSVSSSSSSPASAEMYAIWNNKFWFVLVAIELNLFQSHFFVWCDLGILRRPRASSLSAQSSRFSYYRNFPEAAPSILSPGRLHFIEVNEIEQRFADQFRKRSKREIALPLQSNAPIGGATIAGDGKAWHEASIGFLTSFSSLDRRGQFVGDDRNTYLAMLVERTAKLTLFHAPDEDSDLSAVVDRLRVFPAYLSGAVAPLVDSRFED